VNEDENPLWDRFSINAVPIVIAFEDKGKIGARHDGRLGVDLSKADLDSMLKALE
jgi:thioredoxin 1